MLAIIVNVLTAAVHSIQMLVVVVQAAAVVDQCKTLQSISLIVRHVSGGEYQDCQVSRHRLHGIIVVHHDNSLK